ncbi:MAG: glutamine-hydrolyzing carbamoyl-phosphate synthase small subunit [Planctomycetota bacterium]
MSGERPAMLVLEDGAVFPGRAVGASGERVGEVVFNTSMTGYQEILTDPSYRDQIVVMTYPLIGNYGITPEDMESGRPQVQGFVMKEMSRAPSNFRAREALGGFLRSGDVPGIEGVDTRAITKRLRVTGAMMGILSTEETDAERLLAKLRGSPRFGARDLVREVSCPSSHPWSEGHRSDFSADIPVAAARWRVVVVDYGVKHNILRSLAQSGCVVTVVPATETAGAVLDRKPDGVLLSNGPGDPAILGYAVENVRGLLGRVPVFGICLGHQLLGIACGGKTFKLKFGHRGANHPVMELATGRVSITSQNHGYAVDPDSLAGTGAAVTHINLNDRTVEGLRLGERRAFSVQYHPEASPGPHDALGLFDDFNRLMAGA